jgi:serine/threonine protein phosphatase 1
MTDRFVRAAWRRAGGAIMGMGRRAAPPAIPNGTRVYAFGDIHGRFDLLDQMLDRLDADISRFRCPCVIVVFLGDYVDRGPDSASVIDRLIEVQVTHRAVCLLGNHDALFAQFLTNPSVVETWSELGAIPTLMSYGLQPPFQPRSSDGQKLAEQLAHVMPANHRAFLENLNPIFVCGDYLFVHAGIRPKIPLARQVPEDLLWIRDDFLGYDDQHEKFVVHGHTPVMEPDIRDNRINIDTGAFATGRLTCLVLEGTKRRFL